MTPRFGYGAADGLLYPVCEMSVEANLNESVSLAQADTVYHAPRVFWELLSRKKSVWEGKKLRFLCAWSDMARGSCCVSSA